MKLIAIDGLCLRPGQAEGGLEALARKRYASELSLQRIIRKSIDARKKGEILVRYRALFSAPEADLARLLEQGAEVWEEEAPRPLAPALAPGRRVLIVGSGPAGLFAALRLAERGLQPLVLERGKSLAERDGDVRRLREEGILDPESNVVFGEGGAGTYSDGKLTTRIRASEIEWLFDKLVEHGADPSILYDAKPHIGTDRLSRVVSSVRRKLESLGTEFRFGERVTGIVESGAGGEKRAAGVRTAAGREYLADAVILACGHSARDLFASLKAQGVALEAKGFAVGARIEHAADFINRSQYGSFAQLLPAADYRLAWNDAATGRGCYSFCMCPGGVVIDSSSEPGRLCVNGMSYSGRDGAFSNAALVVSVRPEDWGLDPLGGLEFQRELEAAAHLAGGGEGLACVQNALAFRSGKGKAAGETSWGRRVREADFNAVLPPFIAGELRQALADFDRKIPGFSAEGILIGAETRTSSPLRILRGPDWQSTSHRGLYPAGEGSGYSGGIVSSAVDGIRMADAIAEAEA